MMEPKFSSWMKQVGDTREEEIDCSECLDHISQFVDLELATGRAAQAMPGVQQHLHMCTVCREEYEILSDLARLESRGDLPGQDELTKKLKGH